MSSGHDLSHIRYEAGLSHQEDEIAIIVSKWNREVTQALLDGALEVLHSAGVNPQKIAVRWVPGSYELPYGARLTYSQLGTLDGIICLGCVIQGETRHFDFICDAVAQGIMKVSLEEELPVIFGVLTPDTQQQALDRAGGKYGNKGAEAAVALLELIDLAN